MSRTRLQFGTAGAVVAGWALVYLGVITFAPPAYDPAGETAAKVNRELAVLLAVPTAVYVAAALLLLHFWLGNRGHSGGQGRRRTFAAPLTPGE